MDDQLRRMDAKASGLPRPDRRQQEPDVDRHGNPGARATISAGDMSQRSVRALPQTAYEDHRSRPDLHGVSRLRLGPGAGNRDRRWVPARAGEVPRLRAAEDEAIQSRHAPRMDIRI